jgi:outer membrane protein assembly factor BamE (lipoprotein component of BamABCDE complex)
MPDMKSLKQSVVLVGLMLVAGCATTFRPWNLAEVKEGMDRAEVVAILGEPDSVESKDGAEWLYYSYSEDLNLPLSDDSLKAYEANRELRQRQISRSLRVYRYSVKLVDGTVQTYTELQD